MMGQTNWTSLCLKTLKVALWCTLTRYSWDATNLTCLSIWVAIQFPYWQTDAWTYSFRAWQCPIMPIALFCYGEYRRSRSWNQEVGSKLFTQFKLPLVQFPLFLRGVAAGVVREVGTWVIIIQKPLSILSENSYPIVSAIMLHEWALWWFSTTLRIMPAMHTPKPRTETSEHSANCFCTG